MSKYDLTGLSTSSFERLIQALALKVISPGVSIFGAGPDGGREATYEGRMEYPTPKNPWDGYCVIQAKFLERPRDSKSDGQWAIKQLRGELEKYADQSNKRRIPDYYVFATNVALTAVQDKGSKDLIKKEFAKFQKRRKNPVPIRDFAIWDFDQITGFLDCYEDIRRSNTAWITSGDVLASVFEWFEAKKPDFEKVMANYLAKEIPVDRYARLEQAGETQADNILLAPVFVDLHVSDDLVTDPLPDQSEDKKRPAFARKIIDIARDRLDPETRAETLAWMRPLSPLPTPEPGRFVLIGGPGQGKTTLGQFICQLFRTAILKNRPQNTLTPEVRAALDEIIAACSSQGLDMPKARRFPLRIVLNEFATALSKADDNHHITLLSYLVEKIKKRTGYDVSLDDFRNWLTSYPWLIVLDGLDEVPASSNRIQVLRCIEDFWTDVAQCNADVLVIATTRPQGYSEEFSPAYYTHEYLVPFSPSQAMHYAERLAEAKLGARPDDRDRVVRELNHAANHESTARLMRSPLQVTIMHTLVQHGGTPPQDRWRLFHEYYETIYRREKQRTGLAALLLQEHKDHIDVIHGRVALILQVQNERAGGTEAKLTTDEFEQIVDDRLAEEGIEGQERETLKRGIVDAAANRLVFLAGLEQGRVGFEIPSLREFMAAEALFQERETILEDRLREIAPIAMWRNVFLFAAGRCFETFQHLRDTIYTLCQELNQDLAGPIGKNTGAGSLLAMDLLADGLDRRSPKYAKLLMRNALELMDLPPENAHVRLADLCKANLELTFQEEIKRRLELTQHAKRLGAWTTLLVLVHRGVDWASQLADRQWPADPSEQVSILESRGTSLDHKWLHSRTEHLIPRLHPVTHQQILTWHLHGMRFGNVDSQWSRVLEWTQPFTPSDKRALDIPLTMPPEHTSTVSWRMRTVSDPGAPDFTSLCTFPSKHPAWAFLVAGARFAGAPSKQSLGAALRETANADFSGRSRNWLLTRA